MSNKICRIYAVCGVSQTPKIIYYERYFNPYIKCMEAIFKDYQIETEQIRQYMKSAVLSLKSEKLKIARLVIILGTKCSLRCRDCNNLVPYFKPQKDLDVKKILHSLEVLSKRADTILKCELIGGEPFLSNNLNEVLEFLLDKKNIYQVEITTNGTIMPQQDQISLLQNKKVKVRISDYGNLINKQKIINYLSENEVFYEILGIEEWTRSEEVDNPQRDIAELSKIYDNCFSEYFCKTLYEDKMFICARAASLYVLGRMKEKEYIEIGEETSAKELKEFLLKPYAIACGYCGRTDEPIVVEPAIQLKD